VILTRFLNHSDFKRLGLGAWPSYVVGPFLITLMEKIIRSLANRLRGIYEIGHDGEFGMRDFSKSTFIPRINREAADRVEELEAALNDLLNDCINFDGGKLTDVFMENASRILKD